MYYALNCISEKQTNTNTNGIGGGFYYEYHFSYGESLRINLNWTKLDKESHGYSSYKYGVVSNYVEILELLFLFRMRFISTKSEKTQTAILAGYGIGQNITSGNYSDKVIHSGNIDLELRHLLNDKHFVSIGGLYKITNIDRSLENLVRSASGIS